MDFEFNDEGVADLKNQISNEMKRTEAEANKAAADESTPAAKARAFADVLREHGISDVDEEALRRMFEG